MRGFNNLTIRRAESDLFPARRDFILDSRVLARLTRFFNWDTSALKSLDCASQGFYLLFVLAETTERTLPRQGFRFGESLIALFMNTCTPTVYPFLTHTLTLQGFLSFSSFCSVKYMALQQERIIGIAVIMRSCSAANRASIYGCIPTCTLRTAGPA